MTSKLTITRERLQEIAEDGFLKHGESKELARLALSCLESEPVLYCMVTDELDPESVSTSRAVVDAWVDEWNEGEDKPVYKTVALYTSPQPAPVVPEEPPEHLLPTGSSRDATYRRGATVRGWKLCRAAMLNHSAGSDSANSPEIPEGWVMVPREPTEEMIIQGFESAPDEFFSPTEVWEEYQAMSGCKQAAHRAKLCWSAMIAAAPLENN